MNKNVNENSFDLKKNIEKYIKIIKSPEQSNKLSNEEIDPWLYFYDRSKKKNGHLRLIKKDKNKKNNIIL